LHGDKENHNTQSKETILRTGSGPVHFTTKRLAGSEFQMPLHYPRFTKKDYEAMPEWKLYNLLVEYGLPTTGDLAEKRKTAMGTFLWAKNENKEATNSRSKKNPSCGHFQMPLHYPRYTRKDYETMDEAMLDQLFVAYGLPTDHGDLGYKRKFAMGTFLWKGLNRNTRKAVNSSFQMPLHYPRYTCKDYEAMDGSKLDQLLNEYGLPAHGDLAYKREFAKGAFLWGMESNKKASATFFQMPLHYPKFTHKDYQTMPEWQLDRLLAEYGLPIPNDLGYKRQRASGKIYIPKVMESNKKASATFFQMPLRYPKFTHKDYQTMPEWQLDRLLAEYGLPIPNDLGYKRQAEELSEGKMYISKGMESNKKASATFFQMPLDYPKFTHKDYQTMPEWQLDRLLAEYGLPIPDDLGYKRQFAMGAFLWPDYHLEQKPSP
ncbi:hypothetical protein Tsubulata_003019, partial [Turnera subulata]